MTSLPSSLPPLRELFIAGQWVAPRNGQYFDVVDPTTAQVLTQVARATSEDVDAAVEAATKAFETWGVTTGAQRAVYMRALADAIDKEAKDLARMETLDSGKSLAEAEWDMGDVSGCFRYYADLAEKLDARQDERVDIADMAEYVATMRYEPMGVVGAIIPWNYPLLMALWKVAPALAAGCTMVLKPSELTPLTALQLARIASDVGLPAGVLNVVTGFGAEAGGPLVNHADVQKVAFTGSVPTGVHIMGAAAASVKNVSLELGGKSPAIVFDAAHLRRSIEWIMFGVFGNNGQVCSATSRLLVQEDIAGELIELLCEETKKLVIGNPLEPNVKIGPLVSEPQQKKVLAYIQSAREEGATIAAQTPLPAGLSKAGYYVPPTVITNVQPHMRVWKEEIFGPVLSVMTFKTEQDAIRLANDSEFGLAGAVFSSDNDQLRRVTRALRVGIVWNNCSQPCLVQMPWGGMKKSGTGRELGPFGLNAYLEPKQVCTHVADKGLGFYFDE